MRSIPKLIKQENGKETLTMYRKVEKMETKISDFKNHQRFLLSCLSKGVIPVSLKLKNIFRTQEVIV